MARRIQLRRDTAANWSATNPTLAQGEVGVDLTNNKIKIGNGSQNWNALAYFDDKETVLSNYAGDIIPSTDDTYTLGTPDKRWKDVFVTEGSIYIGDVKLSNSNGTLVINRVSDGGLITEEVVEGGTDAVQVDLTGYATEEYVNEAVGAIEIPDVSNFITEEDIPAIPADISDLTDTEGLLGQGSSSSTQLSFQAGEGEDFVSHDAGLGYDQGPDFQIRLNTQLDSEDRTIWGFSSDGGLTFPDGSIQTVAYAGGVGRAMMIDTNRSDSYEEVGSADRPFKTFAAAIAAAEASDPTAYTFILMGCTVTEDVDFSNTSFTQITISTTCRSVISGNVTVASIPTLSQLVVRNIEIGGTFTLTGDGTTNQMNSCSFYNVSFSGAVNITATNATAFYEAAFFGAVNFTNLSYLYINGAQFNTDWTITADSTGVIPSRGINPGTGGSIAIVFSVIANNVIFVKGGTAAYVFQPHMSRMGLGAGTYTVPAGWTMTPHSTVLRGTWVNNGTLALRNTSHDNPIGGTAPSYVGSIGAASLKFQDGTTQTTAYTGGVGGSSDRLVNGELSVVLDEDGGLTLPDGGTIAEGVVTENPTIEITPAGPEAESQKLVIKGGAPQEEEEEPGEGEEGEEPADLYHLHLTTGNLQETSVFLGTDEHNVRTKIDGQVEITARDYDRDVSKVWKFNKAGELKLPEDTPTGTWVSVNADLPNYNGDIEYRAVTVDEGYIYSVGRGDGNVLVTKISNNGDIAWSKFIVPDENNEFGGGRANGVTIEGGVLYVTCEFYANYTFSGLISVDPATGDIGEIQFALRLADNDVVLIETQFSGGMPVSAGSRYGGFQDYTVTPQEGSGTGVIIIDGTELPEGTVLWTNWNAVQIGGTGFEGFENLVSINFYQGLTGTTSGSGEGAEFSISWRSIDYSEFSEAGPAVPGTGYQIGDTIVIPGTQLGGTSPENDLTIVVDGVGEGGSIESISISGTSNNRYKIETTTQVDFTQEGSWQIAVALYRENFLWTPENQINFGMGSVDDTDRLFALATDSEGGVYVVGESDNDQFNDYQATLFKFDSSLELQWARMLNTETDDGYAKSVAVKNGFVYTVHEQDSEGDLTVVSKVNADTGALVWQRSTRSGDDSGVAVDSDDNVYVVAEAYNSLVNDDAIKVIKLDSTGEIVFKRWVGYREDDTMFKNGRVVAVDDDYVYVVGYVETDDDNSPFVTRLAKDGSGTGEGEKFFYTQGTYAVDAVIETVFAPITPTVAIDTSVDSGSVGVTTSDNEAAQTKEILAGASAAIVFADGTRMNTVPVGIPQNRRGYNDYTLTLADNGKHIFHPGDGYRINVPDNRELALPIGYTVTLITRNDDELYIQANSFYDSNTDTSYRAEIIGVGLNQESYYWRMPQRSIATLIKVDANLWYLSGPGIENAD